MLVLRHIQVLPRQDDDLFICMEKRLSFCRPWHMCLQVIMEQCQRHERRPRDCFCATWTIAEIAHHNNEERCLKFIVAIRVLPPCNLRVVFAATFEFRTLEGSRRITIGGDALLTAALYSAISKPENMPRETCMLRRLYPLPRPRTASEFYSPSSRITSICAAIA